MKQSDKKVLYEKIERVLCRACRHGEECSVCYHGELLGKLGRLIEGECGWWMPDGVDRVCSICGWKYAQEVRFMTEGQMKFCPNCGAEMEVTL